MTQPISIPPTARLDYVDPSFSKLVLANTTAQPAAAVRRGYVGAEHEPEGAESAAGECRDHQVVAIGDESDASRDREHRANPDEAARDHAPHA
jgi:hypothetical protein